MAGLTAHMPNLQVGPAPVQEKDVVPVKRKLKPWEEEVPEEGFHVELRREDKKNLQKINNAMATYIQKGSAAAQKKITEMDKELVRQLALEGQLNHEIRRQAMVKMGRPCKREERDYILEQIKLCKDENDRVKAERAQDVHGLVIDNEMSMLSRLFGPCLPPVRVYHANKPNELGDLPIVTAIKHGRGMCAQLLIKFGAEREIKHGPLQSSTLMVCVLERQQKVLEVLHNNDCNAETRDIKGKCHVTDEPNPNPITLTLTLTMTLNL